METNDLNLLAYCGLYCGGCSFKVAFQEKNREHLLAMPKKYEKYKDVELVDCAGCRVEDRCGECLIRKCAQEKKLTYCGDCEEFPCKRINDFSSDGIFHHFETIENIKNIQKNGIDSWLNDQKNKYQCMCGKKLSWYVKSCIHQP
jgi:hypothetical protein